MLPLYLLGNFHCIGMCGPLVMLLGQHKHRYWYFFGRTLSFSLGGLLAGEIGTIINMSLSHFHIAAASSLIFGALIIVMGALQLFHLPLPGSNWFAKKTGSINKSLTILILKDQPIATFLFGFCTILLPCGQTLIVFSTCALWGDAIIGLLNGFAFALLTSPSLFFAMHAHRLFKGCKAYYQSALALLALLVGVLSVCRGLAELDLISHLVLSSKFHIVIF
jgi:sulfite exporter TauE/SafE